MAVTSPSGGGTVYCMVLEGVGVVSYPPVLLENTDKRCRPVNRIHCPTIALHTCIACKKLPLAPVVLNSYNRGNGNVARREFRIIR